MKASLCIILARSGSKGVPGKNTALVAGKPCIAWTIEAALQAHREGSVDAIAVSSDCPGALRVAEMYGVSALHRPTELAQDISRVDDAARQAWGVMMSREAGNGRGFDYQNIVILYANVPVRPEGLITRAVNLLTESKCDSVQSYARVGKHHPWWMARLDEHGSVRAWEGQVINHGVYRRQDLPPAYVPDGGVLAVTDRALTLEVPGCGAGPHAFFGLDRRGIETNEGDVVDIDSPIDLLVADAILSNMRGQRTNAAA